MPVPIGKRRFWDKVDRNGPIHSVLGTRCWVWMASEGDYGRVEIGGHKRSAHRHAWILTYGGIQEGVLVCHHCDNPPCVRPDHLFLGTQKDNMRDCVVKGRQNGPRGDSHHFRLYPELAARGDRHGSHTHPEMRPRGERHGSAVLTEDKVRYIRRVYRLGCPRFSFTALSVELGVSRSSVMRAATGKTWKHVV
jgi:hypothetical protein